MKQTATKILMDAIEWEKHKLDQRVEQIKALPIELVAQAFPQGDWQSTWANDYEFTMPMNFELESQFKEFCALQGYRVDFERRHIWDNKQAGDFIDVYVTPILSFCAAFRSSKEGTTCVIQKIGEEMKPVFEVICADGAKEGVL